MGVKIKNNFLSNKDVQGLYKKPYAKKEKLLRGVQPLQT